MFNSQREKSENESDEGYDMSPYSSVNSKIRRVSFSV